MIVQPDAGTLRPGGSDYFAFNDTNSENMAKYASDNGIIIYPIYYGWGNSQDQKPFPRVLPTRPVASTSWPKALRSLKRRSTIFSCS